MKQLNKIALLLAVCWSALLVSGCDYVDYVDYVSHTVYEIETKNGKTLKLLCPTVDRDRSELTYQIDGDCVVIN